MTSLIIAAHPDDEALWFSSIALREQCDIVCVTAGRDAPDRALRKQAFAESTTLLGAQNAELWQYPDTRHRLDVAALEKDFRKLANRGYTDVFTHGILGETHNHPHHQDVSQAAHQVFPVVNSIAWNQRPDITNILTAEEFLIKKHIIGTTYKEEYARIHDAYQISCVETFSQFSRESIDIYYWAIANFGDHHEMLAHKYPDLWGFRNSPYELERHSMLADLTRQAEPQRILEFGACEGALTERLAAIADVNCVEKAPTYRRLLETRGFTVVRRPNTQDYDVAVIASFLEYLARPKEFLRNVESEHLVVDVMLGSELDSKLPRILSAYDVVAEHVVLPRWERMYHGDTKEKLETYKIGSHGYLFKQK